MQDSNHCVPLDVLYAFIMFVPLLFLTFLAVLLLLLLSQLSAELYIALRLCVM